MKYPGAPSDWRKSRRVVPPAPINSVRVARMAATSLISLLDILTSTHYFTPVKATLTSKGQITIPVDTFVAIIRASDSSHPLPDKP